MVDKVTYYVDESGNLALFNKKGIPISDGPNVIMLGFLKIKDSSFEQKFNTFEKIF